MTTFKTSARAQQWNTLNALLGFAARTGATGSPQSILNQFNDSRGHARVTFRRGV